MFFPIYPKADIPFLSTTRLFVVLFCNISTEESNRDTLMSFVSLFVYMVSRSKSKYTMKTHYVYSADKVDNSFHVYPYLYR